MEESKLNSEDDSSIQSSSEIGNKSEKEENIRAFTEFLEKASKEKNNEESVSPDLKEKKIEFNNDSFFKRVLNDGFDGISSNPNYKMLGLLIILLINLSLFFVIGNIGKTFLRNAGIL